MTSPDLRVRGFVISVRLEVGSAMLKLAFFLRMALLIASFGAVLGAGLIFWLGLYKLLHSVQEAFGPETNTKAIAAGVMGATDAFLFGVVLIIFASTITFDSLWTCRSGWPPICRPG